ncbi:MAG: hypothetical protein HY941_12390 [Gammaproteobacteria bacterium]|nr:hypothetical protein [Gammaproteobacteria bacterium]
MKSPAALFALGNLAFPLCRGATLTLCIGLAAAGAPVPLAYAEDMPTPEEMQQMQKEMQEGLQQMQEEMNKLDPETRKQVEQMMAHPPAGTGTDDGAAPARDEAKLAAVSTDALDADDLKSYIEALQPKLAAALTPAARERAERIDAELQKSNDYLPNLRASANGLAAWGAWPEAIYLLGKAARDSGSAQDLSNLAALLNLQHAETAALPILYTLNARYPNNSTLLNNLGHARYGLGDIDEAEKLLIAAVSISPLHPQANATLARIQEARGDHQAAQASLHKALQGGFSKDKEEQLRKSGGKLNRDDVRWRRPMPPDPLGLEKFVIPAWPMKAAELPVATREWQTFKRQAGERVTQMGQQQQRITNGMNSQSAMSAALSAANAPFMLKASTLMGDVTEQYQITLEKQMTALAEAMTAEANAGLALNKRIEAIDAAGEEQYRNVAGGYSYEFTCGEVAAEIDNYLSTSNRAYAELQTDMLAAQRRYLNEIAYLSQYTSPSPELFEAAKLAAKGGFAQALHNLHVALFPGMEARAICFKDAQPSKGGGKLANFDDIHCEYISTLTLPGVGEIVSRCNKSEANFNPIFAPGKASWVTEIDDNNNNRLLSASAQVSIDAVTVGGHGEFDTDGMKSGGLSVGASADLGPKLSGGPLEIGVEVGVTANLEFDRSGLTDVGINAGVESKTSSTIGKTDAAKSQAAMKAGANSTWSWSSGFSGEVSGGFNSSVF